jgi:glycyl-tRNA synthetase beta chain
MNWIFEMNVKNLLVELFVEELPPKALKKLGDAFATVLLDQLKAQGLASADAKLTSFASPRRLAAHITSVASQGADKAVSQKLMPVSVGLGADGKATPALLKKLQALGADESAVAGLKKAMDGKAEALFYESTAKGATLVEGLQKALNESIAKLPIPKVMSYQLESGCELPGWNSVSFVRPAHGLVALHGSDVVPVTALGLKAGNSTQGHRFEAAKSPVVIADADAYAQTLLNDGAVIASFEARKAEIAAQLAAAAAKVGGGKGNESHAALRPIEDDALLDEVTALVERPNVLICEFEKQFLDVPQECLILTMKANQKYFPLLDSAGKLTNKFLVVSNICPDDASAVIGGNERVVRPRLADAKFFFDQDRKKTLESRIPQLAKVVYHNKLGSQGERVERVRAIARAIGQQLGGDLLAKQADRAALLAKADLLTDMVGEFPELQGIMGGYYARHDGETVDVAFAIEDHYRPRFAGDELPRSKAGHVLALADKLETIVGMFGIGNLPTGDKDPFALRRHALGVIRMLTEREFDLPLGKTVDLVWQSFGGLLTSERGSTIELIEDFIYERYKNFLKESRWTSDTTVTIPFSSDQIDAVISLRPQVLFDLLKKLEAVRNFVSIPEAPSLAAANKRVGNILKKVEGTVEAKINPALLQAGEEQALADALKSVASRADSAWAAGQFEENLKALAALKEPVDAFFDKVMVNHDDPAIRANRLGLLATLHQAMNRVADLSKLAA